MSKEWLGYPYFTRQELSCKCGCGAVLKDEFVVKLVALRKEANFPFNVTSGARCGSYNAKVSGTGTKGPHTFLRAVDIKVYGERAFVLLSLLQKFGFTGLGVSQKGSQTSRFFHIDDLTEKEGFPRPTVWSY